MDVTRIDRLAKRLAAPHSRRAALTGAAVLPGAAGLVRATAQDATPAPVGTPAGHTGGDPVFLFVQTFRAGAFRPNPGAGTPAVDGASTPGGGASYLLELEGHHGETVYFSDRPDRIFGEAPTEQFLAGLGFGPENPPNAALVAQTETGDEAVVLELLTPAYDAEAGTLTYGAEVLAEYAGEGLAHVAAQQVDAELPERFGRASLFIDDCSDLKGCYNGGVPVYQWYVGPIPGGPVPMCYDWATFGCVPCNGNTRVHYDRVCTDYYGLLTCDSLFTCGAF